MISLIDPLVLAHVLHEMGYSGGWKPDDLTARLVKLVIKADEHFKGLLELGFPEHVWAVRILQADIAGTYGELMARRVKAMTDELRPEINESADHEVH
jgi:hypothetical protein